MQPLASIPSIVEQHAEDAAFLWMRRRVEIDGPLFGEVDIGRLDQRLDANLEGLMASGQAAWDVAQARFNDYPEPGELFVLAVLALRWRNAGAMRGVLDLGAGMRAGALAAVSGAIARCSRDDVQAFVADWVDSPTPFLRALGLCALFHHRAFPGQRMRALLGDPDPEVRVRALKLAGRSRRPEWRDPVREMLQGPEPRERLAAASALALLGDAPSTYPVLDRLILTSPEWARAAMELRLLATPDRAAKQWLQPKLDQPHTKIIATASIGLFADRSVLPWLIDRMGDPTLADAAGATLRDLFEIDFNDTGLFADPATLGPLFADREEATLPSAQRVLAWWEAGGDGASTPPFRSMRHQRVDALRNALRDPELMIQNWRRTRVFPAWA